MCSDEVEVPPAKSPVVSDYVVVALRSYEVEVPPAKARWCRELRPVVQDLYCFQCDQSIFYQRVQ